MNKRKLKTYLEFAVWVESDFLTDTLYDIVPTIEEAKREKAELETQGLKVKIIPTPTANNLIPLMEIEAE